MPWRGDREEEQRGRDEAELEEQAKLVGEQQIEEDEAEREDDSNEALGEQVERGDGGEGKAGEELFCDGIRTKCGGLSTPLRSGRDDEL